MFKILVISPVYPSFENPMAGVFLRKQLQRLCNQEEMNASVLYYRPSSPPFPVWLIRRSWWRYYYRKYALGNNLAAPRGQEVLYQRNWVDGEDVIPPITQAVNSYIEKHSELHDTKAIYANWLWTGGAIALGIRKRFGWPVLAMARGSEMHYWQIKNIHCRKYVSDVLSASDLVAANCEALRQEAEAILPGSSKRMEIVYNGCDSEEFRPPSSKEHAKTILRLNPKERVLLFCGELIDRKGINQLLTAWQMVCRKISDWHLYLVGGVPSRKLRQNVLSLQKDFNVHMIGRVDTKAVIHWMQAADAYIQPSVQEGLANATMEAMATALPVISTDCHGQKELLQNGLNGYVVPPDDPYALAQAIEQVSGDLKAAMKMGEEARKTIESNFQPAVHVKHLAHLLREMADLPVRQMG